MTKVDVIQTLSQFEKILKDNTKVAVHFTYSWSWRRQCGGISRKFSEAVVTYPKVKFITVIVDENLDTAIKYHSTAMIFRFYIDGTEFSRLLFANEYELNEELKELSDSIIDTSEQIDDTSISSGCKNPSCNPFLSNSDHKVDLLNVFIGHEPVEILPTDPSPSTNQSSYHNPFGSNSDHRVDLLNVFTDNEPVEALTTEISSSTNEIPYYNPFDSDSDHTVDLLNVFTDNEPVEALTTEISSSTNEIPYYNPFGSDSDHTVDLLNVFTDHEPVETVTTEISSSTNETPYYNPFGSDSDHTVDLLNVLTDHEPVKTLTTDPLSSTNQCSYYNPFASSSDQKEDPLYQFLVELEKLLTLGEQEISDAPGLELSQNLESDQITDSSNRISLKQGLYSDEFMQTEDPYISSKLSIDSIHTNASPLTGCMPHPNYYTFSSDSGHHKVDQVNNLSDYVPGKIISTHFYEQPPSRNFRSKYDVNNTSPYKHADNGASRHISRKDRISQQRRKIRSNTQTQPSTVPNAMNSACFFTNSRIDSPHVSSKLSIDSMYTNAPQSRNFRSENDVNDTFQYKYTNNGASRHISRKDTKISQQRRKIRGNTRIQPSTVPNPMNSTYCYPSTIPRTQNANISPHPTRRKSCCLSFCCIYLFATLIVVFLISVVIIIVCARNF